jgi:hypothetical protein
MICAESLRIHIQMLTNLKTPIPPVALSQVPTPKTRPSRTVSKHQLSAAADHRPVMQPCHVIGILLGAVVSQLPQVSNEVAALVFHPFFCVVEVGVIIV